MPDLEEAEMVEIPDAMAIGYRELEKYRLHHNEVGAKSNHVENDGEVIDGPDTPEFITWQTAGYPIASVPAAMSLRQFNEWRDEWYRPRTGAVKDVVAPLRDAWVEAEMTLHSVGIFDVDLTGMKVAIKASTLYDKDMDLDAIEASVVK